MSTCLLCGLEGVERKLHSTDESEIACERCGTYRLTKDIEDEMVMGLTAFAKEHIYLVSAVCRHNSINTGLPFGLKGKMIRKEGLEGEIIPSCPATIEGKALSILSYFAKKSPHPGASIETKADIDYPIGYCKTESEYSFFLHHLKSLEFLEDSDISNFSDSLMTVTARGWEYLQNIPKPNAESDQAFVAMWFDPSMTPVFKTGIEPLEADTGFRMVRIDMEEFNDKICDRINAEIRLSRFLIADVTESRPAVYFEAGFAMGLNLPVIWTCRKDKEKNLLLCFDTRQYKHIIWNTPEHLREQLKSRILAKIGQFQGQKR